MKSCFTILLCTFITACSSNTRPSDDQLRSAVVAKMERDHAPAEAASRVKKSDIDNVSCTGTELVTCNFQISGVAHVRVFGKTGDGIWTATSVD